MSVMVAHQRRVGRVGSIPTYSKSSYGIVTDVNLKNTVVKNGPLE
jgi:hypothetical protein